MSSNIVAEVTKVFAQRRHEIDHLRTKDSEDEFARGLISLILDLLGSEEIQVRFLRITLAISL